MTVAQLLDDCARLGIALWAEGDTLHVRGPATAGTPALQDALRQHKPELLRRLQTGGTTPGGTSGSTVPAPARRADAPLAPLPALPPLPLSPGQQGLWFLHRLDPG